MCNYTLTLDDGLVGKISSRFKDEKSMRQWMQREFELMVIHYAETSKDETNTRARHNLHQLRGVLSGAKKSVEELRDEYISEKYGV